MATFFVLCRVSGGITGTRTALLKSNGVVREFTSRAAAEAKAQALNREMNTPYSVADFHYSVITDDEAIGRL